MGGAGTCGRGHRGTGAGSGEALGRLLPSPEMPTAPGGRGTQTPPACASLDTRAWKGPGSEIRGAALLPVTLPGTK